MLYAESYCEKTKTDKQLWNLRCTAATMATFHRAEALQHQMLLPTVLESLGDDFQVLSVLEPANAQQASNDDDVALNKAQIVAVASHIAAGEARMEAGLLSLRSTAGSIQRHHAAGALRLAASSSVHAARRNVLKALFYLLVSISLCFHCAVQVKHFTTPDSPLLTAVQARGKLTFREEIRPLLYSLAVADLKEGIQAIAIQPLQLLERMCANSVASIMNRASNGSSAQAPPTVSDEQEQLQHLQLQLFQFCSTSLEVDSTSWAVGTLFAQVLLLRSSQSVAACRLIKSGLPAAELLKGSHMTVLLSSAIPAIAALAHNAAFAQSVLPFAAGLATALLSLLTQQAAAEVGEAFAGQTHSVEQIVALAKRHAALGALLQTVDPSQSTTDADDPTATKGTAALMACSGDLLTVLTVQTVWLAAALARGVIAGARVAEEERSAAAPWLASGMLSGGSGEALLVQDEHAQPGTPEVCLDAFEADVAAVSGAAATSLETMRAVQAAGRVDLPAAVSHCTPASALRPYSQARPVGTLPPAVHECASFVDSLFDPLTPPSRTCCQGRRYYPRLPQSPEIASAAYLMPPVSSPGVATWPSVHVRVAEAASSSPLAEVYAPTTSGAALRTWLAAAFPLKGARARKLKHDKYLHAEVLLIAANLLQGGADTTTAAAQDSAGNSLDTPSVPSLWVEARAALGAVQGGDTPPKPSEAMAAVWSSVIALRTSLGDLEKLYTQSEAAGGGSDDPTLDFEGDVSFSGGAASGAGAGAAAAGIPSAASTQRRRAAAGGRSGGRDGRGLRTARAWEPVAPNAFDDLYTGVIGRLGFLAGGYTLSCVAADALNAQQVSAIGTLQWRVRIPDGGVFMQPDSTPVAGQRQAGEAPINPAAREAMLREVFAQQKPEEDMSSEAALRAKLGYGVFSAPGGEAHVGSSWAPVWVATRLLPARQGTRLAPLLAAAKAARAGASHAHARFVLLHSFPWSDQGLERMAAGEVSCPLQAAADPSGKSGPFGLALRGVLLYALEGWVAPPSVLAGCLALQRTRAEQREYGLSALRSLLATSVEAGTAVQRLVDSMQLHSGAQLVSSFSQNSLARQAQKGAMVSALLQCTVLAGLRQAFAGECELTQATSIEASSDRSVAALSGLSGLVAGNAQGGLELQGRRVKLTGEGGQDSDNDDVAIGSDDDEEDAGASSSNLNRTVMFAGSTVAESALGTVLADAGAGWGSGGVAAAASSSAHLEEANAGTEKSTSGAASVWSAQVRSATAPGVLSLPGVTKGLARGLASAHHAETGLHCAPFAAVSAMRGEFELVFNHLAAILARAASQPGADPLTLVRCALVPWTLQWDAQSKWDARCIEGGQLVLNLGSTAFAAAIPGALVPWDNLCVRSPSGWACWPLPLVEASVLRGSLSPADLARHTVLGAEERCVPIPPALLSVARGHWQVHSVADGFKELSRHLQQWAAIGGNALSIGPQQAVRAYRELLSAPSVLSQADARQVLASSPLVKAAASTSLSTPPLSATDSPAGWSAQTCEGVWGCLGELWSLLSTTVHLHNGHLLTSGDADSLQAPPAQLRVAACPQPTTVCLSPLASRALQLVIARVLSGALACRAQSTKGRDGSSLSQAAQAMYGGEDDASSAALLEMLGMHAKPCAHSALAAASGALRTLACLVADALAVSRTHGQQWAHGDTMPSTAVVVRSRKLLLALVLLAVEAPLRTKCMALQMLHTVLPFHSPAAAAAAYSVVYGSMQLEEWTSAADSDQPNLVLPAFLLRVVATGSPAGLDFKAGGRTSMDVSLQLGEASTAGQCAAIATALLHTLAACDAWAPSVHKLLSQVCQTPVADSLEAAAALWVLGGGWATPHNGSQFCVSQPSGDGSSGDPGASSSSGSSGDASAAVGDLLAGLTGGDTSLSSHLRRSAGRIVWMSPTSSHSLVVLGQQAAASYVQATGTKPHHAAPVLTTGVGPLHCPQSGTLLWLPTHRLHAIARSGAAKTLARVFPGSSEPLFSSLLPWLRSGVQLHEDTSTTGEHISHSPMCMLLSLRALAAGAAALKDAPAQILSQGMLNDLSALAVAPPQVLRGIPAFLPHAEDTLQRIVMGIWERVAEQEAAPTCGPARVALAAESVALGSTGGAHVPLPASIGAAVHALGGLGLRSGAASLDTALLRGLPDAMRSLADSSAMLDISRICSGANAPAEGGSAASAAPMVVGEGLLWVLAQNALLSATGRPLTECVAALAVNGASVPRAWMWLHRHRSVSTEVKQALAALHFTSSGMAPQGDVPGPGRGRSIAARPAGVSSMSPAIDGDDEPMAAAVEGIFLDRPLIVGREFVAARHRGGRSSNSRAEQGEGDTEETYIAMPAQRTVPLGLAGVSSAADSASAALSGCTLLPLGLFDVLSTHGRPSSGMASAALSVFDGATVAGSTIRSLVPTSALVVVVPPAGTGTGPAHHRSGNDETPGAVAALAAAALTSTAGVVGTLASPGDAATAAQLWEAAATSVGGAAAVAAASDLGFGTARDGRSSWQDMVAVSLPGKHCQLGCATLVPRSWVFVVVGAAGFDLSVPLLPRPAAEALHLAASATLGAHAPAARALKPLMAQVRLSLSASTGSAGSVTGGSGWFPAVGTLCHDAAAAVARSLLTSVLASLPADVPLPLADMGGASRLLRLLRLEAALDEGAGVVVPGGGTEGGDGESSGTRLDSNPGDASGSAGGSGAVTVLRGAVTRLLAHEPPAGGELLGALKSELRTNLSIMQQEDATGVSTGQLESAHPAHEDSTGAVALPGCAAMWVTFHHNTCTNPSDPEAHLAFYADPAHTVLLARFKGGHYSFVPFLAHTPHGVLYYRHCVGTSASGAGRKRVGDWHWGFRAMVRGVNGVSWFSGADVPRAPSFLWGCWVLDLLADKALPWNQLDRGAVHNDLIVNTLLDYLATPQAPFKPHVVGLLTRLFSVPMHFDLSRPPPVQRVTRDLLNVVTRVHSEADKKHAAFQPLSVLQANELVSTALAAEMMLTDRWSLFTPVASLTPTPLIQAGVTSSDRATLTSGTTKLSGDFSDWFPPVGLSAETIESHDTQVFALEGLPLLTAMAYLRELLKAFATAARTPDIWLVRAAEFAHDGGQVRGGGRRVPNKPPLNLSGIDLVAIQRTMTLITAAQLSADAGLSLLPTPPTQGSTEPGLPQCLQHIGQGMPGVMSPSHPQFATLACDIDQDLIEWLRSTASKQEVRVSELSVWALEISAQDLKTFPSLSLLNTASLRLRSALLILLNTLVNRCLKLIDTSGSSGPWSTGALLRQVAHLVFPETKELVLNTAINRTRTYEESSVAISLDNDSAAASKQEGRTDIMNSTCLFVQMFRELRHHRAVRFRSSLDSKDRLFKVDFAGEPGIDWGGIYRDSITRAVNDLFVSPNPEINLFVRLTGGDGSDADDLWIPNVELLQRGAGDGPEAAEGTGADVDGTPSARALAMWRFAGVLMGISWRTRAWLDFTLAPIVWKGLTGEEFTREDLRAVDPPLAAKLEKMFAALDAVRSTEAGGAAADARAVWEAACGGVRFVHTSLWRRESGAEELIPSGSSTAVTPENVEQFARLCMERALAPFRKPLAAIRSGLLCIVPGRAVQLCRWQDLTTLVGGPPDIDQAMLMKHTRYSAPFDENHEVVKRFWRVFEGMSARERSQLVRYAWGRSKLPRGEAGWITRENKVVHFLLYPFYADANNNVMRGDESLVESHSCFFQLKIPMYRSDETMRRRLLESIEHGLSAGAFMLA